MCSHCPDADLEPRHRRAQGAVQPGGAVIGLTDLGRAIAAQRGQGQGPGQLQVQLFRGALGIVGGDEGDGGIGEGDRLVRGRAAQGLAAGTGPVSGRQRGLARFLIVPGKAFGAGGGGVVLGQQAGDLAMQADTVAGGDHGIGGIVDQHVAKAETGGVVQQEAGVDQGFRVLFQRLDRPGQQRGGQRQRRGRADHGDDEEQRAQAVVEPADPGRDHRLHRVRQAARRVGAGGHGQRQFFQEERVAGAALGQGLDGFGRGAGQFGLGAQQRQAVVMAERRQLQLGLGQGRPVGRAGGQHQKRRAPVEPADQRVEQRPRRGVDPVDVLEDDDQRVARGGGLQQPVEQRVPPPAPLMVGQRGQGGVGRRGVVQQFGQQRAVDGIGLRVGRQVREERAAEGADRRQRRVDQGGQAIDHAGPQMAGIEAGQEFGRQARFADAGRAAERDGLTVAVPQPAEAGGEKRELGIAADEARGRPGRAGRNAGAAAVDREQQMEGAGIAFPAPGGDFVAQRVEGGVAEDDLARPGRAGQGGGDAFERGRRGPVGGAVAVGRQFQRAGMDGEGGSQARRGEIGQRRGFGQIGGAVERVAGGVLAALGQAEDGGEAVDHDMQEPALMRLDQGAGGSMGRLERVLPALGRGWGVAGIVQPEAEHRGGPGFAQARGWVGLRFG
ncbi:MAG: hypothetical protein R3D85_14840 [Paracoccaceae bacterium]